MHYTNTELYKGEKTKKLFPLYLQQAGGNPMLKVGKYPYSTFLHLQIHLDDVKWSAY